MQKPRTHCSGLIGHSDICTRSPRDLARHMDLVNGGRECTRDGGAIVASQLEILTAHVAVEGLVALQLRRFVVSDDSVHGVEVPGSIVQFPRERIRVTVFILEAALDAALEDFKVTFCSVL